MRGQSIPWKAWVAGLVILSVALGWWALYWRPNSTDYPVQGVDISAADGVIAWPTVEAAGADFAYAKATEGADISDPRFAENWAATASGDLVSLDKGHAFTLIIRFIKCDFKGILGRENRLQKVGGRYFKNIFCEAADKCAACGI